MYKIQHYIFNNIQFLLLALSLVAGAIVPLPFRTEIYMAGLFYLICYALINWNSNLLLSRYFILFLIICVLSCIASNSFNYRLYAFIAIVISVTPITSSIKLFFFRKAYLKHCLMIFPLLSLISLFCFIKGINYYEKTGNILDFSGIFQHPMWMGAAIGLSNIVTLWLIFFTKNRIIQILYILILLLSIYMTIVSGSRSALFASLITMSLFLIVKLHNIKKIILASCLILMATVMLLPYYLSGAQRMIDKFEASKGAYGSRTELFTIGVKHFKETPILGVGFAVSYNALGEKKIGRMESGSGWLSILFQTGLLGFSVILFILWSLRKVMIYIWKDYELLLYLFAFGYLCLHSLFEGYILTVGYYPCILFWCLLGYLYAYPYYKFHENNINFVDFRLRK